jgi:hypothetical protein
MAGELCILREGKRRVRPALFESDLTELGDFVPARESGAGNSTVGFSKPHAGQSVTVKLHLEAPESHRATS